MNIYSAELEEFYPFDQLFPQAKLKKVSSDFTDFVPPGFVIFWGGMDIHPSVYSRTSGVIGASNFASARDIREAHIFINAWEKQVPILGICRGAQLGCVMSGGILIQDVTGHSHPHYIEDRHGNKLTVDSSHHQMMYPWAIDHELIAWASPSKSFHFKGITDFEKSKLPTLLFPGFKAAQPVEPEIVWFPQTKCLGVQFHPEEHAINESTNSYLKPLIEKYLLGEK